MKKARSVDTVGVFAHTHAKSSGVTGLTATSVMSREYNALMAWFWNGTHKSLSPRNQTRMCVIAESWCIQREHGVSVVHVFHEEREECWVVSGELDQVFATLAEVETTCGFEERRVVRDEGFGETPCLLLRAGRADDDVDGWAFESVSEISD
jgi:hypothetical protein